MHSLNRYVKPFPMNAASVVEFEGTFRKGEKNCASEKNRICIPHVRFLLKVHSFFRMISQSKTVVVNFIKPGIATQKLVPTKNNVYNFF